jgi:hypothetical protein
LLLCVLANGLQEAVPCDPVGGPIDGDHRLVHEPGQGVEDRELVGRLPPDRTHRLERPASGEHGQGAEERALLVGEKVVAPLNGGPERLVPRQRAAPAAGQEPEAIVQPREDLLDRKNLRSGRREFDGERHPVQALAQRCDELMRALAAT